MSRTSGAGIAVSFVADNLALEPSDLTPFSIVAPVDPRLPGGGGYVVADLYDVVPGKSGQVNNLIADSADYGRWEQRFDGIDVTVNARAGRFMFAGGTSTGQTVADNCGVRARLPELATTTTGTSAFGAGLANSAVTPLSPYCDVAYGVLTQFRGLSTYLIPRIEMQVSAVIQSKPGAMLAANYVVPNADVVPSLGRSLSGGAPNVTVNLVAPGTMYGDRINQLDVRASKILKLGDSRTMIALDVYNALNSSAVLTYNPAFVPGGTWLQPTAFHGAAGFQDHRRNLLLTHDAEKPEGRGLGLAARGGHERARPAGHRVGPGPEAGPRAVLESPRRPDRDGRRSRAAQNPERRPPGRHRLLLRVHRSHQAFQHRLRGRVS